MEAGRMVTRKMARPVGEQLARKHCGGQCGPRRDVKTTDGGGQYAQKRDDQCDPNRRDWAPEAMVQGSGRSRETSPAEVRHLSMAPIPDPIRRDAAAPQK